MCETETSLHDQYDDRYKRNTQHLSHLDALALLCDRVGVT